MRRGVAKVHGGVCCKFASGLTTLETWELPGRSIHVEYAFLGGPVVSVVLLACLLIIFGCRERELQNVLKCGLRGPVFGCTADVVGALGAPCLCGCWRGVAAVC